MYLYKAEFAVLMTIRFDQLRHADCILYPAVSNIQPRFIYLLYYYFLPCQESNPGSYAHHCVLPLNHYAGFILSETGSHVAQNSLYTMLLRLGLTGVYYQAQLNI